MRKTKAEAEKTRQQLLNAALEIFYRNGVANTSLQAIAEEAGMTRGAVYWHFKNKEDLFDALFAQNFLPFVQEMEQIFQLEGDAWDNLRHVLQQLLHLLENNETQRKFCSVIHSRCEQTGKNESITQLTRHYHQRSYLQLHRVLTYCRTQGSLPENTNIDLASIYLKSSITGLLHIWVLSPEMLPLSRVGTILLDIHLSNLKTNPVFQNIVN